MRPAAVAAATAAAFVAAAVPGQAVGAIPWCGSAAAAVADRTPDGTGFEWHAVYAHASDRPNRFLEWAPRIAGDAAAIDAWWRRQDPRRRRRWDLEHALACSSEFGRLDITSVSLPRESAHYVDAALVADHVVVGGARLFHADKGFLIYVDGGGSSRICGQVPPSAVTGLTARRAGSRLVLRWQAAADLVGLRGYRVHVGGVRTAFVTGTTASLAFARARGRLVTVEAVDHAGNAGRATARTAPRR